MTDNQRELMKWIGEFIYSAHFFETDRRTELLKRLTECRWKGDTTLDARALLLAYREHAQELLDSIRALEKIVALSSNTAQE